MPELEALHADVPTRNWAFRKDGKLPGNVFYSGSKHTRRPPTGGTEQPRGSEQVTWKG